MAKGKFDKWLESENLILLSGWARNGLTDEQIAHNMRIGLTTLYDWKNKFPKIANALKENKEIADIAIENVLYQKALSGDMTAVIFWLKNRRAMIWRDKQDINANVDSTINIKVDIDDNV